MSDAVLKGYFLAGLVVKAPPGVLLFPVIKKTLRDVMAAHELGRGAHPAKQFFDNLAFEFDAELSSLLHGKILPPIVWDFGSCRLL